MHSQIERYRELGALIRAAQAELRERQISLTEAHERELHPGELGVQIANLGRQIAMWKREQEGLFRDIAGKEETELMSSADCARFLERLKPRKSCQDASQRTGDSGTQLEGCVIR